MSDQNNALLADLQSALDQGRWTDGFGLYAAATARMDGPGLAAVPDIHLRGLSLALTLNRQAEANALFDRYASLRPDDLNFAVNAANIYLRHGRNTEAARILEFVTRRHPHDVAPWDLLIRAYINTGLVTKALDASLLGAAHTGDARFHINASYFYHQLDQPADAIAAVRKALILRPDLPNGWSILSMLDLIGRRFDRALAAGRRATRCAPGDKTAWIRRANAAFFLGQIEEAITAAETGTAGPDPVQQDLYLLTCAYRLRKRYADAGRVARRWPVAKIHATARAWTGERLNGECLLLFLNEGLGDMFMFLGLAHRARAHGAGDILVACPESMVPLTSRYTGPARIVSYDAALKAAVDVQAPLNTLMHYLVSSVDDLADRPAPYLSADPDRIARWQALLPPPDSHRNLRIGLHWAAHSDKKAFLPLEGRSFPLAQAMGIAMDPRVQAITLQVGGDAAEADAYKEILYQPPALDAEGGAFMDTAAIMAHCDLIITCCTSVAHLAGALGRPVWVILKDQPEWRWGLAGDRMDWYPTMRLFRQAAPGDWRSAFRVAEAALEAHFCEGAPLIP